MPEREYFDYDEWMRNTGGDRGYGSPEPPQYPGAPPPAAGPASPPPPQHVGPPTRRIPPGERPSSPDPNATWNDDWWDGRSDHLGGWLVSERTNPMGGGSGSGGGNQTAMPGSPSFQWPTWQSAGAFKPRDDTFDYKPFAHPDFAQTSWDDVVKQPGYEDSEKRLRQQIEAGAAYKGMVRSGMAIGDLYSGLDSYRGQRFNEYDNRRFRDYSANRDNAFGAWQGNLGAEATKFGLELGVDKDIYDRYATDVDRGNNFRFNTASKDFEGILSKWLKQVDSLTSIATAGNN